MWKTGNSSEENKNMGVKISGAELEIMEYLWKRDEKCTFAELLDYFNENRQKDWCKHAQYKHFKAEKERASYKRKEQW